MSKRRKPKSKIEAVPDELLAEVALRRQARAGGQQPELDGGPEAVERLLERGLRADRREYGLQRREVGGRQADSRAKPRTRSQSVTAASDAVSSTSAMLT